MAKYCMMKEEHTPFAREEIGDELYSDAYVLIAKDKHCAEVLEATGAKAVDEGNAKKIRLVESFEKVFGDLTFMLKAFRPCIQMDIQRPLTYKANDEWYDEVLSKKMIVLIEEKMEYKIIIHLLYLYLLCF